MVGVYFVPLDFKETNIIAVDQQPISDGLSPSNRYR